MAKKFLFTKQIIGAVETSIARGWIHITRILLGPPDAPAGGDFLLIEDGTELLLENGDQIILG